MWRVLFAGVLCAAPLSTALAWGDDGHRIVCEIAFLEMAPATRAEVEALMATDQQFASFAEVLLLGRPPAQAGRRALCEPAPKLRRARC